MASGVAVLEIIRAARPAFRSAHDRAAFAEHASFLAGGYSLTAVGSGASSLSAASASESPSVRQKRVKSESRVGMNWKVLMLFSTREEISQGCVNPRWQLETCFMVDVSPADAETPTNVEIKTGQVEREREVRQPRTSILEEPSLSPGFEYPEIPSLGGNDLLPGAGAGIFAPRRDIGIGGGSMLVGPGHPRWGCIGVGPQPGRPLGLPPGGRFDPFGPPGVPGFEPNQFIRDGRPPGGPHPDLEHFSPF